ncbi:MAG: winged helix-turn-helix domain-containing protein [Pseudolabrys sp.]
MLRFADFELDLERGELRRPDGNIVRLRPKALALLRYLADHARVVVSKQELMEAVWPNVHVGEDSLFQCIRDIRTAIGDDRRQLIKVVSGRGYLFDTTVVSAVRGIDPAAPATPILNVALAAAPAVTDQKPAQGRPHFAFRRRTVAAAAGFAIFIVGLAAAAPFVGSHVFSRRPPIIAIAPFLDVSGDPHSALMAARLTESLTDGLSKIPTIRVLAPQAAQGTTPVSAPGVTADLVLRGELEKNPGSWTVQARLIDPASDEVRWTSSYAVSLADSDAALQQSRLAAGIGYPLAMHISAMIHSGLREGNARIVIDQATAFINRTSREKFDTAQKMLESALAASPDNVDLQTALAAQLLRGVQTAWFRGKDAEHAEQKAKDLLERAVKAEPNYIPVLEGYCRFLTATNGFVDSLVACSRSLTLDPWDGLVLFNLGISQLQLGRFDDALSTFLQADRLDTPQVSRWTWLLGAGLTYLVLDQPADAVPWLNRSLAITPGTGRTHFVLAAAYQRLGRFDDAKAALAAGMAERPGSNAGNVALPKKNASPVYLKRSADILALLVAAGLPQQ